MSDRKSGRSRKVVDYTKFGGGDDDDDDFADSTPPVSKKPRLSNKENKDKKVNKKVQKQEKEVNLKQKSSSNRKSLDDRRYERELQEALELSMSQSDPSQETAGSSQEVAGAPDNTAQNEAPPIIIEDDEKDAPSPILPDFGVGVSSDNPPVLPKMTNSEDEIQVLEKDVEEVPSSRRGASKKKNYIDSDSESGKEDFEIDLRKFLSSPLTPKVHKKNKDSDSDFAPENDDDSLSDDDNDEDDYNPEDSDSDFGSSKKKKPSKTAVKTNTSKGTTKNSKDKTGPAKPSVSKPTKGTKPAAGSKTEITHKPLATSSPAAHRTPGTGLTAHKPPNWKPPAAANGVKSPKVLNTKTNSVIGKSPVGINTKTRPVLSGSAGKSPLGGVHIKSPSSGLRLGLSRNMKLKPLHPNLKMQN